MNLKNIPPAPPAPDVGVRWITAPRDPGKRSRLPVIACVGFLEKQTSPPGRLGVMRDIVAHLKDYATLLSVWGYEERPAPDGYMVDGVTLDGAPIRVVSAAPAAVARPFSVSLPGGVTMEVYVTKCTPYWTRGL